jgi:hypothetical protein
MNTANLQLEGLCIALAAINQALVDKGVLSNQELDLALGKAEATAMSDERVVDHLSPANTDAICFPIRLLRLANADRATQASSFSELAKRIGASKRA